jgi:hypothetical protein
MAVAPSAQVPVVAAMMASVVAHVILSESALVVHQKARHVAVAPVAAIRHVVLLTKVDGLAVVLAVAWVVTHRLPASTVLSTPTDRASTVVIGIVASVPHLLEAVDAGRHTVPRSELDVVP